MNKSDRVKRCTDERKLESRKCCSPILLLLLMIFMGLLSACQFSNNSATEGEAEASTAAVRPQLVTRDGIIDLARRYASHTWTPTEANVKHGPDSRGIRVDTPDVSFSESEVRPGWWLPDQPNQGIPYKWGGFSTIEGFDHGIEEGLGAGDVYTFSKQGNPANVSQEAVGIDASGLVSRCWRLPSHYSTTTLPEVSVPLQSYDELEAGDILLLPNTHALIFEKFANPENTALLAYESGTPPSWKVLYDFIPVSHLEKLGYQPYRYRLLAGLPILQKVAEAEPDEDVAPRKGRAPFVVSPDASFNPWR